MAICHNKKCKCNPGIDMDYDKELIEDVYRRLDRLEEQQRQLEQDENRLELADIKYNVIAHAILKIIKERLIEIKSTIKELRELIQKLTHLSNPMIVLNDIKKEVCE